jgi:hypothetical protein
MPLDSQTRGAHLRRWALQKQTQDQPSETEGGDHPALEFAEISESITADEGSRMKSRILIWAAFGFFVAAGWALYAFPTLTPGDPLLPVIRLTCPVALFSHHPIPLAGVLLANAATYALVGLGVEILRLKVKPAH